jgi:hypothetical protein
MKKIMEPRTMALLVALAIGLGIALHEFFFVVALCIVLIVAVEWTARTACEYLHDLRSAQRHS